MADKETKSTMREFAANDQPDYYSGITSIVVNRKNAYELKGKFLDDLHKNAFSGTHGEDAVEHIEYFFKIIDPINLPNKLESDEIEPTNEETSDLEETNHDDEQETSEIFRIETNLFDYETLIGYSEWPTYSWKEDGYCHGGNLPGAYIVGNALRYQDLEWYNALKDSELKDEALRNKAIMDGLIDENNELINNDWRRWDGYEITDHDQEERKYENEYEDKERYKEYVAIKEDEYDDLTNTSEDACRAYQEIFCMMDEGWMEVIVNGDAPAIASASASTEGHIPPKTFHGIKDAKTLWEAIKARFGGNKESKKMQKTILKQQYENFTASRSKGVDKTYDRFYKLISLLEIHDDTSSMNEVVNTAHDVPTASLKRQASSSTYADDVIFSFFINQSNSL
ncbi:hypothetical protein Tco_1308007 [Tanacetum coccineum]